MKGEKDSYWSKKSFLTSSVYHFTSLEAFTHKAKDCFRDINMELNLWNNCKTAKKELVRRIYEIELY